MRDNSFRFSQKVTGQERKAVASVIAEALGGQVRYAGAPGFAYEAGGWAVDRDGVVHSPEIGLDQIKSVRPVIEALSIAGLSAEGSMTLTLAADSCDGAAIENLKNLLDSKQTLLKKALGVDGELSVSANKDEITFPFWNATLNADEALAYITLAWRLSEQAKTHKRISRAEKPADNEKYAFLCFLLRLGFIGEEFKNERKVVQNLEGLGFTVVPFGQGFKDMSPPTKELMKLTLEEKIAHGGHPVLRWMMETPTAFSSAALPAARRSTSGRPCRPRRCTPACGYWPRPSPACR